MTTDQSRKLAQTSSLVVAERPRDASCLSVVTFNRTICGLQSSFISYFRFRFTAGYNYGRPLSVSGRPCYILPMFLFYFIFYGRLILRPWLTEVRENFTRGRP